jgi:hypothetical protein
MSTAAAAEMKNVIITLLGMLIIALPTITIGILYSLPSQAMAQSTAGTPYPYSQGAPTTTTPPYSNMPPSNPYVQTPQQQPLVPALPSSPSSPQIPSQNPQQILPPQSSSPLLGRLSPLLSSSSNNTSAAQPQLQPPQLSPGTTMTGPQMSSLTVITRLNNTNTGSISSPSILNTSNNNNSNNNATASFPQVVTNAYSNPDGYTVAYHFFRGSQTGVVFNLPPGIYSVSDQGSNNTNSNNINNETSSPLVSPSSSSLTHTYSGDCNNVKSIAGNIVGYGQINLGESKTCIITYNNHK